MMRRKRSPGWFRRYWPDAGGGERASFGHRFRRDIMNLFKVKSDLGVA